MGQWDQKKKKKIEKVKGKEEDKRHRDRGRQTVSRN